MLIDSKFFSLEKSKEKRHLHCPICGKYLMKASGTVEIEMKCEKCKSDIIAKIKDEILLLYYEHSSFQKEQPKNENEFRKKSANF